MSDFYQTAGKKVIITPKIIEQIKGLKSFRANDSGYCPDGLMLQWRYEDNNHLSENDFKMLYMPMQFICMTGILTDDFKSKYNVEYHHEALLRRLYIDLDSLEISTAFKRPFGNSDVQGDVAEKMKATFSLEGKLEYYPYNVLDGMEAGDDDCEDYNNRREDLIDQEYFRFIDILEAFMREFELQYTAFVGMDLYGIGTSSLFVPRDKRFDWGKYLQPKFGNHRLHSYMDNWKLCESELRDEKLNKILS